MEVFLDHPDECCARFVMSMTIREDAIVGAAVGIVKAMIIGRCMWALAGFALCAGVTGCGAVSALSRKRRDKPCVVGGG